MSDGGHSAGCRIAAASTGPGFGAGAIAAGGSGKYPVTIAVGEHVHIIIGVGLTAAVTFVRGVAPAGAGGFGYGIFNIIVAQSIGIPGFAVSTVETGAGSSLGAAAGAGRLLDYGPLAVDVAGFGHAAGFIMAAVNTGSLFHAVRVAGCSGDDPVTEVVGKCIHIGICIGVFTAGACMLGIALATAAGGYSRSCFVVMTQLCANGSGTNEM